MHLRDPSGFPITQKKWGVVGGAASNGSLQTIVLTRTNPISCHLVGGDQLQARVQRENAVITGQVTNTTILRQPAAC